MGGGVDTVIQACQGQVSAEGILHLFNPNLGSNFGKCEFLSPEFWGRILGCEFLGPMFSNKKSPLKNSPSRNSPPKIHIKKFTPEFVGKFSTGSVQTGSE